VSRKALSGRRVAAALLAILAAALIVSQLAPAARTREPRPYRARALSPAPCGTLPLSSVSYTHVVWIWMENHSEEEIIGSGQAPYINSLASACGLASNYHNISHPSLPNYIGATSGLALASLARFDSDCNPKRKCSTPAASVFAQVASWRAYEESMPKNCDRRNKHEYAARHDPPPYYTTLAGCAANDVPYTQLASDLTQGTLPAFSFVTPNLVDDMHDGSIAQGDSWLSANLPAILRSSAYRAGNVAVFVTWDEGEGGSSNECAANTTDVGCHVATIVVSPSTAAGTNSSTLFNHYSLLRSTEQLLGVAALGEAASAPSMLSAFNL
jgi:phosphatidylinositol-3-phosphatase